MSAKLTDRPNSSVPRHVREYVFASTDEHTHAYTRAQFTRYGIGWEHCLSNPYRAKLPAVGRDLPFLDVWLRAQGRYPGSSDEGSAGCITQHGFVASLFQAHSYSVSSAAEQVVSPCSSGFVIYLCDFHSKFPEHHLQNRNKTFVHPHDKMDWVKWTFAHKCLSC